MDSYNNLFVSLHPKLKNDQLFKTRLPEQHFIFSNPLLEHATKNELKKEKLVNSYFLKALGKESKLFQLIIKNNKSNHPLQLIVQNSNKSTKNIRKKTTYPFIYINNNKSLSRRNSFYNNSNSHPFYDFSPKITSTKNQMLSTKSKIKLIKTRKKEPM